MPLKIGNKARDFTLPSTNGKSFTLSKDAHNQPLIIFFYPKDFTRVCTKEACGFRDNYHIFKGLDILVVGISTDSVEAHKNFKARHELPFELLSDRNGRISKTYRAYIPLVNISRRVTYLLDAEHRIKAVYSELFGAEGHIQKMIDEVKKS